MKLNCCILRRLILFCCTLVLCIVSCLCARRKERNSISGDYLRPVGVGSVPTLDPGTSCKQILKPECHCSDTEIKCINAQMTDTRLFHQVNASYPFLASVTFRGNNFAILSGPLFGNGVVHSNLKTLNLSANYIINLNGSVFSGVPNLEVLDLSYNEIVLKNADVSLLQQLPELRRLRLRRSFNPNVNHSRQWVHLRRILEVAQLHKLEYLDLSLNFWSTLPRRIGCFFPKLKHLSLRQNHLTTLDLDHSCLQSLETLDLTANDFMERPSATFQQTAAGLNDYTIVINARFKCDCRTRDFVQWLQDTRKVRNRDDAVCRLASPRRWKDAPLLEITAANLTCEIDLDQPSGASIPWICDPHFAPIFCSVSAAVAFYTPIYLLRVT